MMKTIKSRSRPQPHQPQHTAAPPTRQRFDFWEVQGRIIARSHPLYRIP
ncbi:hypothetical protein [Spirulina major]|nr:hypothetical protein [Spirulina major]